MKILFKSAFNSIKGIAEIDLPELVILTGLNGSGKTHLLRGIELDNIAVINEGLPFQNRRFFDFVTLIPQDTGVFDQNTIDAERVNVWSNFQGQIQNQKNTLVANLRQHLGEGLLPDDLKSRIFGNSDFRLTEIEFKNYFPPEEENVANKCFRIFNEWVVENNNTLLKAIQGQGYSREFIKRFDHEEGAFLINCNRDEFIKNYPMNTSPTDIFSQSLGRIFGFYGKLQIENKLKRIEKSETGISYGDLTELEFRDRYGVPPWEFVNSIFKLSRLDFQVSEPDKFMAGGYQPLLFKSDATDPIPFSSLSSGEKILMSFALCVYNISARDTQTSIQKPDIILFDEIDATLHPSMSHTVMKVIEEKIVKEMGIKVIWATHSPTTIALSPESSIFTIEKGSFAHEIKKVTKNEALSMLTSELPFLGITYENRKQVFVEAENDAKFHEKIFNFTRNYTSPDIFLYFIASGAEGDLMTGNSTRVKHLTKKLRDSGNELVYGLIDWDLNNTESEAIFVSGFGNRYSLENYLFDPILFGTFLAMNSFVKPEVLNLKETDSYEKIGKMTSVELDEISKSYFTFLESKNIVYKWEDIVKTERISGELVSIPRKYLESRGHDIENQIRNLDILGRYKSESRKYLIFDDIVNHAFKNLINLIPKELIDIYNKIQKA